MAAVLAAVFVVVIVVVVVVRARPAPAGDRPSVRYLAVTAATAPAHAGGYEVTVSIELEVTSRMPHVAPHVNVHARCGPSVDEDRAFFMDLSNAVPGDHKVDSARLFSARSFEAPPPRCELTLSLSEGATPPQKYCLQDGRTTAGPCP